MRSLLTTACMVAMLSAASASASTMTLTPRPDNAGGLWADGFPEGITIRIETAPDVWEESDSSAGRFAMRTDDPALGDIYAFCVEFLQGLGAGGAYDMTPTLFGTAVLDNLDKLFDTAYDQVVDSVTSAAFQVAVWEIVEDSDVGLDLKAGSLQTGSFIRVDRLTRETYEVSTNAPVENRANGFLEGLGGPVTTDYDLTLFSSDATQDLVSLDPLSAAIVPSVPLPAGGWLLLAGLGGLAATRRARS